MPAVTKPVLPPLRTPQTASFPSEIIETPLSCVSAVIKQEQGLKTPITPPMAYMEFLKALTPILASPPPSALQRSLSDESTATRDSMSSHNSSVSSFASNRSETNAQSTASTPTSAQPRRGPASLKRLRIPGSPAHSCATPGLTPRTAMSSISAMSPGMSATSMLFSPFSPADWTVDGATRRYFDSPRSACTKPVCVRSVVTRTVTYRQSPPLDPAPKGKKRKHENDDMPPPPSKLQAVSTPTSVTPVATSAATEVV